jgi:hypothetical protein
VIDLVLLVVLTLAVARLCVLMVEDKITEFFREWVVAKLGPDHLVSFGVVCPWCWSVWFAFPMTAITFHSYGTWPVILTSLAVSFVASKLADV